MKTPLLYLVHRIPYPPNKGDKIRSFHILSHLAKTFDIYLGAFVDEPNDWQYENELNSLCKKTCLVKLNPSWAKLRSIVGFFKGEALTLPYYQSEKMQTWVDMAIEQFDIRQAVVFSSAMAPYLSGKTYNGIHRIIDFVDVDSDKWAQYSKAKSWPMSTIYSRESRCLLSFERKIAKEFNASFFVSDAEAHYFKSLAPESSDKIKHFSNGVNAEYFSSKLEFKNPYKNNQKNIVFTGAMDYWANIDAVVWFSQNIFPRICEKKENCNFFIVGSNPSEQVINLGKKENIIVTGRVEDIRPYLKFSDIVVAPLRIARGIQNKVLEAMSMSCVVVATSAAAEGIKTNTQNELILANDSEEFANTALMLLDRENSPTRAAARRCILEHYSWHSNLLGLLNSLKISHEDLASNENKDTHFDSNTTKVQQL